jgi:immune inhibitor A
VKKVTTGVLASTLAAAVAAGLAQAPAGAAMRADAPSQADRPAAAAQRPDVRPGPLTARQDRLRAAAVEALIDGSATKVAKTGGGSVVKLGKGKSVEFFDNKKQARVLSILSEFGDQVVGRYGGSAGPVHNAIPRPDRSQDNSTTWEPDYNQAYYETLFNGSGESMKTYYQQVSGGRYTVDNTVQGWTKVPYNGAYYGANPREDEGGSWDFIEDTGNSWYAGKLAELGSKAAVEQYLSQFDVWDRYDHDGDLNYNEADGYIDHFQAIHAGEGEEAGASADAIWSHRWYVNGTDFGVTGPTVDGNPVLYGGSRIGDSKYFIGDYTVEPENGGLGVFVHEYGHDLGLPDFYDTAGGDNGTSFWTTMSSGSWLGHGAAAADGIGTTPNSFGPDEKMFLGWLDHQIVQPGQSGSYKLSAAGLRTPAQGTTQAVVVNLPDQTTRQSYTTPPEGSHAWWSGRADGLNNTLARSVPAASSVKVAASGWYRIEAGYDYLYGEYSLDGGTTWVRAGAPIDGTSRGWENLSWSYRPGGKPSLFRFRYQTDGGVNEAGAFLDSIVVTADRATVVADGAESGANGWTVDGWTVSTGTDVRRTKRYYLLENRQYVAYDATLATGPYNFSEAITRPNWVEFFPYQDGLLVWFADKAYADNNTSQHPGHGQALPVDARPAPFTYPDGTKPGNRRQPFDATFGLQATDTVCLHKQVAGGTKQAPTVQTLEACAPSNAGDPTFDDTVEDGYWSTANPQSSTKVAGLGVTATVTSEDGGVLTVDVVNP